MNNKLESLLEYSKAQLYEAIDVEVEHGGSDGWNDIYFTDYKLLDVAVGSGSFLYDPKKILGWRRFYPLSMATSLRNPKWEESKVSQENKLYLGTIAHVKTLLALENVLPDTEVEVQHQLGIKPEREAQLKAMGLEQAGMSFSDYLQKSKSYLAQKGFDPTLMRNNK